MQSSRAQTEGRKIGFLQGDFSRDGDYMLQFKDVIMRDKQTGSTGGGDRLLTGRKSNKISRMNKGKLFLLVALDRDGSMTALCIRTYAVNAIFDV